MKNLLVYLKFRGDNYHGWQIQNGADTVQLQIQKSIQSLFLNLPEIKGCSRTDAKVHANEYCFNFKINTNLKNENIIKGMNSFLNDDIAVFKIEEKDLDFHARYSCKFKEYKYKVYTSQVRDPFLNNLAWQYKYNVDFLKIQKNIKYFEGRHDFSSFCAADSNVINKVRTIKSATVEKIGDNITFTICGDGFLYNMVRIIVGTLLEISSGVIKDNVKDIIEFKDRKKAGITAPPYGLFLNKVTY